MLDFSNPDMWSMVTIAVVGGCAIPILTIVLQHQRQLRQAELDNQLKRDLVAQGRSADEIQAILEMSSNQRT